MDLKLTNVLPSRVVMITIKLCAKRDIKGQHDHNMINQMGLQYLEFQIDYVNALCCWYWWCLRPVWTVYFDNFVRKTHQNPIEVVLLMFYLFICLCEISKRTRFCAIFGYTHRHQKNTHLLYEFIFFVLFCFYFPDAFLVCKTNNTQGQWVLMYYECIDVSCKCSRINTEKANRFLCVFVLRFFPSRSREC